MTLSLLQSSPQLLSVFQLFCLTALYITPGRQAACTTNTTRTRTRRGSPFEMAAAVTRRVGLHVEATNGGADDESRRNSSAADHSPVAKRINDAAAKGNDVWVAAQEGDMPAAAAGNSSQPPLLFRTMKVKGSILHPYRLFWPSSARLSSPSPPYTRCQCMVCINEQCMLTGQKACHYSSVRRSSHC